MKKLLILPLLVLLTGCVTYYYPQTALEDGVYYAEDDPSYAVYSDGYAGTAYYPWSSLDYFYLGYNPYPRFGFGYGYGYGSRFSLGISYGYSPWHYPRSYYGYYSPWYASYYHYPYYPARHSYGGHRHDRYTGNDQPGRRDRTGEHEGSNRDRDQGRYSSNRDSTGGRVGSHGTSPVNRRVSTPPSGHSGSRGMVIRSRETTKIGKSRLEPGKPSRVQIVSTSPSSSRKAQTNYRTTTAGNEVRYRAGSKKSRSRTGPVEARPQSRGIAMASSPKATVVPSGNGGRGTRGTASQPTHQASGRAPSESRSQQSAAPKTKSSSGNAKRSRAVASSSGHRESKNKHSTRRKSNK